MISLIGTLIGFGTSIVPEVLGYFKQKQANEQELRMLEAKAKYASQLSELRIKELDAEAEIQETKSIYEHDRTIDSGPIINSLRGSVRPVITSVLSNVCSSQRHLDLCHDYYTKHGLDDCNTDGVGQRDSSYL